MQCGGHAEVKLQKAIEFERRMSERSDLKALRENRSVGCAYYSSILCIY